MNNTVNPGKRGFVCRKEGGGMMWSLVLVTRVSTRQGEGDNGEGGMDDGDTWVSLMLQARVVCVCV